MMVMTAKVDYKKILVGLVAVAALIVALVMLLRPKEEAAPTAAPAAGSNDSRVAFLEKFGWDVTTSPKESGQVKIPEEDSEMFSRYNALQKSQGYDLSQYAGKTVMRYVYQVNNFPGATEPVYATLLVYKNQIIGGDVTNTGPKGVVQGFGMLEKGAHMETTQPATLPTEPTIATDTVIINDTTEPEA